MRQPLIRFGRCIALIALSMSTSVFAQSWESVTQGNLYVGAGAGVQRSNASLSRFAATPIVCTPLACVDDVDDASFAPSVYGGLHINDYVALEIGYVALQDSYSVQSQDPNFAAPTLVAVDQDSEQLFVRGVFTLPLSRFSDRDWLAPVSVSGVVGIARWRSQLDFKADLRGAGFGLTKRESNEHGIDFTVGARLNYDANEQVRFSLGWDRYSMLSPGPVAVVRTFPAQTEAVKAQVDVFSLSVNYRFR